MEINKKSTASLLKQEILTKPVGEYAPYYFKYLGYRTDLTCSRILARGNAVYSLFAKPDAYIYKNDLIVGSNRSLFIEADADELVYASSIVDSFGERGFAHNYDHFAPDYTTFVQQGIPGILSRIEESYRQHADAQGREILSAMKQSMVGLQERLTKYAQKAKSLVGAEGYNDTNLQRIAEDCAFVANNAPQTFRQALQLVWLTHVCFVAEGRYAMALGRMDMYLYPFYQRDVQNGVLTAEQATELLENVFMKIYERRAYFGGDDVVNICIGGTDIDGNCTVNDLSYCILHAVKNVATPGPNLSARIAENVSDEFLDECLQSIGTGIGYPALMNDRINIQALSRLGYEKEDIYNYAMVGCIENFIAGKQPPWTDGRFDTPRFLEFVFNNGKGILNKSVGIDTGNVSQIKTMDEFMEKYETQLHFGAAEYYARYRNENSRYANNEYTQPFISCFCEGCIESAKDICGGGSKYPSAHGVALMGVGTVCDSLAAIEKTVFVDKTATLEQIRQALLANFEGYVDLRNLLMSAPKYGNNDDFVDKYAVWYVEFLYKEFSKFTTCDGGSFCVAMAANTNNIWAGKTIAATPDGRKAGEPLSDAASPTYGKDIRGVTQTVQSVTKPDYTKIASGTVINQKFSPEMFQGEKRKKLLALLKVYFKKGGQEMQINATSRKVLEDAMQRPQDYSNLVVRVSGFSAFYVTLDKDVQIDILNRTQQG